MHNPEDAQSDYAQGSTFNDHDVGRFLVERGLTRTAGNFPGPEEIEPVNRGVHILHREVVDPFGYAGSNVDHYLQHDLLRKDNGKTVLQYSTSISLRAFTVHYVGPHSRMPHQTRLRDLILNGYRADGGDVVELECIAFTEITEDGTFNAIKRTFDYLGRKRDFLVGGAIFAKIGSPEFTQMLRNNTFAEVVKSMLRNNQGSLGLKRIYSIVAITEPQPRVQTPDPRHLRDYGDPRVYMVVRVVDRQSYAASGPAEM